MREQVSVYESKMKKTLASLESELMTIRAGRANPNILNKLTVDYYGTPTPIQQVGNISVPEARMIVIQPWELTEDRRKELVKDVKKKGEQAKVAVRNIRRDGNDAFKKLKGSDVSEDEIKDLETELQKVTDKYIKEVDKAVDEKSKEVMTV